MRLAVCSWSLQPTDPEDLVQGKRGSGETVLLTSTKAIEAYREAVPTGTEGLTEAPTSGGN